MINVLKSGENLNKKNVLNIINNEHNFNLFAKMLVYYVVYKYLDDFGVYYEYFFYKKNGLNNPLLENIFILLKSYFGMLDDNSKTDELILNFPKLKEEYASFQKNGYTKIEDVIANSSKFPMIDSLCKIVNKIDDSNTDSFFEKVKNVILQCLDAQGYVPKENDVEIKMKLSRYMNINFSKIYNELFGNSKIFSIKN